MTRKTTRRAFLGTTAAAAAAAISASKGAAAVNPQNSGREGDNEWANWSGSVHCTPATMARPASVDDVVAVVRNAAGANQAVRAVGSGHSFVPLGATDDALVVMSRLRGVESIDVDKREATVLGGSKLYHLGKPLLDAGLALENMPDIDRQALAGAIATGTHGTGRDLGSLSTQVVGLRLVVGNGDVVDLSAQERPDLFRAAQVSLGALGIITHVRLRLLPAYRLHEKTWTFSYDECVELLAENIANNRHFEFFWVSGRDSCLAKTLNPTEEPEDRETTRAGGGGESIGPAHEIFPSERNTLFNEIEYAVPHENGPECLEELRQLMFTKHKAITWPLEYRTVARDDIYLSPAHGRATVTISAHQPAELSYEPFFSDAEAVFRNHQGRPHWGKIHSLEADDLEALYPKWDAFQKAREELDPDGRFLTPYLRSLLG